MRQPLRIFTARGLAVGHSLQTMTRRALWKSLMIAAIFSMPAARADSGFTGAFDSGLWTFASGNANGETVSTGSILDGTLTLTGSMNLDGIFSIASYSLGGLDAYRISFDWEYATTDVSPAYDPAGYLTDIPILSDPSNYPVELSSPHIRLSGNSSGSITNAFFGGGIFGFYVLADNFSDADNDGYATLTISNFSFTLADPDDTGDDLPPTPTGTSLWTGATSSDWNDETNWDPAGVPGATKEAVIDDGASVLDGISADKVSKLTLGGSDGFTGSLTVENGGAGSSYGLVVDSGGSLLVTGEDSVWDDTGDFSVVNGGSVTVSDGGTLTTATNDAMDPSSYIDYDGSVTITGDGSSWSNPANLTLYTGTIDILDHATATLGNITLGGFDDNIATITVGDSAELTANSIGFSSGTTGLLVEQGGRVSVTTDFGGGGPDSNTTITVKNLGSQLSIDGSFYLGSNVSVSVEDSASLMTAGGTINSGASVIVKDADTTWTDTGNITVDGGSLRIENGAVGSDENLNISGDGHVTVTGNGSIWTDNSETAVGVNGDGTLTISDHAVLNSTDSASIGYFDGNGFVTVSGEAVWNVAGLRMGIFDETEGTLTIESGGVVNHTGSIGMANGTDTVARLTVTGTGSLLTSTSSLQVGNFGSATALIEDGGKVTSGGGSIGGYDGGSGDVTVTGADSSWEMDAGLYMDGPSSLTIADGGTVTSVGSIVGNSAGSGSTVTIGGTGSSWTDSSSVVIGYSGSGSLFLSAGGSFSTGLFLRLGQDETGSGTIIQTGGTLTVGTYLNFNAGIPVYSLQGGTLVVGDTQYAGILTDGNTEGYIFQLGGGTIQAKGESLTSFADASLTAGTTSTMDAPESVNQVIYWEAGISGDGGLRKTGIGVLALDEATAYTGPTTISGGTIRLGADGALSASTNIRFNGGMLEFGIEPFALTSGTGGRQVQWLGDGGFSAYGGDRTIDYEGGDALVWGTGNFVPDGHALLLGSSVEPAYLDPYNPFTPVINSTVTFPNAIDLNNATRTVQVFDGNTAVDAILSGDISNGGLIKTGDGTLSLTGTLTYAGDTEIRGGTLRISDDILPANTNIKLNGGVIEFTGSAGTTSVVNGTGAGELQWLGSGGFSTFGGDRTIGYAGGAALTWGHANFVSDGGTLILSSTSSDSTTLFPNAINFNGGSRTIRVDDGSAPTDAVLGGILSNGSLTKTGDGTLALGDANTYAGATLILGGTISTTKLANGGAASGIGASPSGAENLVIDEGTLQYTGSDAATTDRLFQIGRNGDGATAMIDASGAGTLTFSNPGALTFGTADQTRVLILTGSNAGANTFAPSIDDNGAGDTTVVKNGTGSWVLSGTNTYHGNTVILEGTLALGAGGSLSDDGAVVVSGGAFDLGNDHSETIGIIGLLDGSVTGTGASALTADSFYVEKGSISAILAGPGDLTKDNPFGTVTLSGANTYSGGTDLYGGTLIVANDAALGTGALLLDGGELQGAGGARVLANPISLLYHSSIGGSSDITFTGTLTLSDGDDGDSHTLDNSNTGATTFGNIDLTDDGTSRVLTISTSTAMTVSGVIANGGAGTGSLTKNGPGTLTLADANTYTGGTTISGGVLSVGKLADGGANSGIGTSASTASNLVLRDGTLQYTGPAASTNRLFQIGTSSNSNDVTGTLDASGTGAINFTNTGAITFGRANRTRTLALTGSSTANNTLAAVISNNGTAATSLTKSGDGTWVLTGANTYTGNTTVSAGTLALSGSGTLGAGDVAISSGSLLNIMAKTGNLSIASGKTLSGAGTIAGDADSGVAILGTLSPGGAGGASIGLLTVSGASLTLSGTTNLRINTPGVRGTAYDAIDVGATLTYGGTLNLTFAGTGSGGDNYQLFNFGAPALGNFDDMTFTINGSTLIASVSHVGQTWIATTSTMSYTFSGGSGTLALAAVPEPVEYGLALAALLGGVIWLRRRRIART